MRNFQDIFPGLSRSWNFQKKIQDPGLSRRRGNPERLKSVCGRVKIWPRVLREEAVRTLPLRWKKMM